MNEKPHLDLFHRSHKLAGVPPRALAVEWTPSCPLVIADKPFGSLMTLIEGKEPPLALLETVEFSSQPAIAVEPLPLWPALPKP